LGIVELRVGRRAARKKNGIAQVSRPVRDVIAGVADFSGNRYDRRVLEIKSPEHPHRIEGLERQVLSFPRKSIFKIERQHLWGIIWRLQTNNLGVRLVRLWHNIFV